MNRDENLNEWIEDAIEKGANNVEEIHKAIANLPLNMLEQSGFLDKAVVEVRKVQDQSIGVVYDTIRDINHRVGELASELLRKKDSSQD